METWKPGLTQGAEPGLAFLVALAAEMFLYDVFCGIVESAEGSHGWIRLGCGPNVVSQGIDRAELEGHFWNLLFDDIEAAEPARLHGEIASELGVFVEHCIVNTSNRRNRTEFVLLRPHGIGDGDVSCASAIGRKREPDDLPDGHDHKLLLPEPEQIVRRFLEQHATLQHLGSFLESHGGRRFVCESR